MQISKQEERKARETDARREAAGSLRTGIAAVFAFLIIGMVPVVLAMLTGPAAAGASAGFVIPLQNPWHWPIFVAVGLVAIRLPRLGVVMLPLCFIIILCIGALTDRVLVQQPVMRWSLFVLTVLYGLCAALAASRMFLLASVPAGICAFYLGMQYAPLAPDVASPGFFIMGFSLSSALAMACGASIGFATLGYASTLWNRQPDAQGSEEARPGPLSAPKREKGRREKSYRVPSTNTFLKKQASRPV